MEAANPEENVTQWPAARRLTTKARSKTGHLGSPLLVLDLKPQSHTGRREEERAGDQIIKRNRLKIKTG